MDNTNANEQGITEFTWRQVDTPGCVEVMPAGDSKQHYMGDECWCGLKCAKEWCSECLEPIPIFIHRHSLFVGVLRPDSRAALIIKGYDGVVDNLCKTAQGYIKRGHHG